MRLGSIVRLRLRSLFARRGVEQELDAELSYHLERQIEEYRAAGMTDREARHAALREMGGTAQRKEECRDMRRLNLVDNAIQDFRYAIRQLRKSPGFTCTAIFVLALGIAAAVTIFGLVDGALIKPLPYRDQSRLVDVSESSPGWPRSLLSYDDFRDWKKLNHVFSSIDAYAMNGGFTLTSASGAEQVGGTRVSSGFFKTLGISPTFGRDFRTGEDSPSANRTAILSYGTWLTRFGGAADVLGKTVTLNGAPYAIIGVLPREFQFAPFGGAEFWTTLRKSDSCEQHRECHNLYTVARMKDGISMEAAAAEMKVIARQLQKQYPDSNRDQNASLTPLRDVIIGDVRPILLVLLSGACVLLLIACLNVTMLLLARFDSRRREIAVRGALGASSARLFHQFAMEGLVLSAAAGTLGLFFSEWIMRMLADIVPEGKLDSMPWLRSLGLDARMVVFASGILLVMAAIFAIIPMLRTPAPEMMEGLREGARGASSTTWRRFGANLLVAQVALAMVLMVSSGLLGKSLYVLLHVDTGMQPDHLASVQVNWAPGRYSADEEMIALERRILNQVSLLPGVKSAASAMTSPIGADWGTTGFHLVGGPNHGEHNEVLNRQVSPSYFTTLGARLIRGRYFNDREDASKPQVAIINRTMARKYFGGEDPIGKQIYDDWAPRVHIEIVGVVDDIKEGSIENANWPALYRPFDQNPTSMFAILVRTSTAEKNVLPELAGAIHHIDRDLSVHDQLTMTERIDNSPAAYLHRSSAWVVGSFAGIAFALGVVGLYGVVAYSVSRRTREIGVRMALGAEPRSVYRLILGEAARLVGTGTALGIAGSLGSATLIRGLLYGVRPWDVSTMAAAIIVLGLAAILASYMPARRAASVNPVEALRSE